MKSQFLHEFFHLGFNCIRPCTEDGLNVVAHFKHPGSPELFKPFFIDFTYVVHLYAETGNAGVQGRNILPASESLQDLSRQLIIVSSSRFGILCFFRLPSGCFQIEFTNDKTEHEIVDDRYDKPYRYDEPPGGTVGNDAE